MVSKYMKFNDVCFHGLPLRIYSNGDIEIDQLSQVLLKIECDKPGVHTEFGKFVLSYSPDISKTQLKRTARDYPEILENK